MGCDRNLFTLRLVLNQTRGEWQWQATAVGWVEVVVGRGIRCGSENGGGLGAASKPPHQGRGSSPRPLGPIEGWRDGASEGRMKRTNDEWCASDKTACPTPQMEWLSSRPESRMNHASSILQNAPSLSQTASQSISQSDGMNPTDLDGTRSGQLAKNGQRSKNNAPSKLALGEKFCGQIYLSYSFVFLH